MRLTKQGFNHNLPENFAQVFVFDFRDHAQRFVRIVRQADLNGAKVEAHAARLSISNGKTNAGPRIWLQRRHTGSTANGFV